jgi:hypothetical protein
MKSLIETNSSRIIAANALSAPFGVKLIQIRTCLVCASYADQQTDQIGEIHTLDTPKGRAEVDVWFNGGRVSHVGQLRMI